MEYKLLVLVVGLAVLILGGEFLVRGASRIALRLNISPLVVGLTIVAFGTSSPELLISINTALSGNSDMTMGNVIGSNICNLALVLGVTAFFSPISVNKNSIRIDWPVVMGSSVLLYLLVLEGHLNRYEGIVFVLLLISYIYYLIKKSRKDNAAVQMEEDELKELKKEKEKTLGWVADVGFVVLGCLGLFYGSDWFITGAKDIFLALGVEERVIGIVVLALGTSLPELVTSIVAAFKKNTDLAIGNLMGSNIFNVLSILGITSIIKDIEVSEAIKAYDIPWMLGITLLLLPLMAINKKMSRIQGSILLSLYFIYTYSVVT